MYDAMIFQKMMEMSALQRMALIFIGGGFEIICLGAIMGGLVWMFYTHTNKFKSVTWRSSTLFSVSIVAVLINVFIFWPLVLSLTYKIAVAMNLLGFRGIAPLA